LTVNRSEKEILIIQYIHGELDAGQRAQVEQLLKQDEEASLLFQRHKKLWLVLDGWKAPQAPGHLGKNFSTRLARQVAESGPVEQNTLLDKLNRAGRWWSPSRLGWNLAGASLAAVIVAGFLFLSNLPVQGPMPGNPSSPGVTVQNTSPEAAGQAPVIASASAEADSVEKQPGTAVLAGRTRTAKPNRLSPTGIMVETLPSRGSGAPEKAPVQFAVNNFSSNIPEMNTKYYASPVYTSYDNPF
jgi:anti-sigma factor RsiW